MGFQKHLPNFPDLLVYLYNGEEYGNESEIHYAKPQVTRSRTERERSALSSWGRSAACSTGAETRGIRGKTQHLLPAPCPQLLSFLSLSEAATDLRISRCLLLGSRIHISYKRNLQHLLLSQPSEPSERENTGYWEAHGCLCGIYLSSITHKDLWGTSSIQWLRNQSQRKLQWLYLTPAPEIFSSPLTTQLHVLPAELMSFSVCPDL